MIIISIITVLPILMGIFIASQTAINSKLTSYTKLPLITSAISFAVGALFLGVLTLITKRTLLFSLSIITNNPLWIWLGGFTAAFALTSNILLFKYLGSIGATLYPIVGQIIMSLLIDQFGWFNSPQQSMNWQKLTGTILLLIGLIIFINIKKEFNQKKNTTNKTILWQLLGIAAGVALAIQNAVNAKLGAVLFSPVHASFISFVISFIILFLINTVAKAWLPQIVKQSIDKTPKQEWWIWTGGILGSSYVALSSVLVPQLGTGQVVILALFGQLIFSALIQQFGWFKSKIIKITGSQILGTVIMFIGIILIKFG